jgi:SAM-dependent methyltransferase
MKLLIDIKQKKINHLLQIIAKGYGIYQPIPFKEFNRIGSDRNCDIRWNLIKKYLFDCKNMIDLGCNTGYYVFESSKIGIYSTGIDNYIYNIEMANELATLYMIKKVSFKYGDIDSNLTKSLPIHDACIFFSVFHHLVHSYGFLEADEVMKNIYSLTKKYLFFETGQYNENTKYPWRDDLQFMGKDPEAWIFNYLQEIGFKKVEVLGQVETHLSHIKRSVFIAKK